MFATIRKVLISRALAAATGALAIVAPIAGQAQSTTVAVVEVPTPNSLIAELRRQGRAPTDELMRALPAGTRTFLTIATRDGGWLGELAANSTPTERLRLVEQAAGVVEAAALAPAVSPAYRQVVAGLQRRLREESPLVTFDQRVLGARDLLASRGVASVDDEVPAVAAPANGVIPKPRAEMVRSKAATYGSAVAVIVILIAVIAARRRNALRREDAAFAAFIEHAPNAKPRGSHAELGGRTLRQTFRPAGASVRLARHRTIGAAPPSRQSMTIRAGTRFVVMAMLVALPVSIITPQGHGAAAKGPTADAVAVPISVVAPQGSGAAMAKGTNAETVAVPPRNTTTEADMPLILVDISGSVRARAVRTARQVVAALMTGGRAVDLKVFGDSVVHVGKFVSVAQADSNLTAQPSHRRTRLSDAVVSVLDTTRRPHRTRLVVMISDFQSDDNGNEALRYLPSGAPIAGPITAPVNRRSDGLPVSDQDAAGIALVIAGSALLTGLFIGRRSERRDRCRWLGQGVRLVFCTRAGRTFRDLPIGELTDAVPLFATGGAAARTAFALEAAPELELTSTITRAGVTIAVGPRGNNHLQPHTRTSNA